jgi:hypothetical protein
MTTSTDFVHWTPFEYIAIDGKTAWPHHLYTTSAHPYYRAPLILMFPKRFMPGRKCFPDWPHDGLSDVLFFASRDGVRFTQPVPEAFLRPGLDSGNWHDRAIYVAPHVLKTGDGEMSLYTVQNYRAESIHVRRFTLREDGFVSVHASAERGALITKPLVFEGNRLEINYSTSAAGAVRVELQDAAGKPVPGHAAEDCPVIFGDEISRIVRWKDEDDVSDLAGSPVRLRFEVTEADVYSFRFSGQ